MHEALDKKLGEFLLFARQRLGIEEISLSPMIRAEIANIKKNCSAREGRKHSVLPFDFLEKEWCLNSYGIRFHYWSKEVPPKEIHAHNHPWSFCSLVLSGRIHDFEFACKPGGQHSAYKSHGRNQSLTPDGVRQLFLQRATQFSEDQYYFKEHDQVHYSIPRSDGTATLIIRGPYLRRWTNVYCLKRDNLAEFS